jgi:putative ABC transport system permease protein
LRLDEGIRSASLAAFLPLTLVDGPSGEVRIERYQRRKDGDLTFLFNVVAPDYFQTLRIELLAGRDFSRRDDTTTSGVAIVNEAMARRFWGTIPDALGKRLSFGGEDWRTVVGVARNVKYARLTRIRGPMCTCRSCSATCRT